MSFPSLRSILLSLAACLAFLPVKAQLDPRLQVVITDLLQVYQAKPANPELLTVYDMSGSMHAVYWNGQYYSGAGQASHNAQWDNMPDRLGLGNYPSGDFPGIVPAFDSNGYIWMVEGTGYYQDVITNKQASQFQTSGGLPTAQLIAPDGSIISINHSKTYNYSSLTTLALQASHIRVTATATVSIKGIPVATTRTIDLPIPWGVMDTTNTSTNNASSELVQLVDPSGGPSVYPDTLFQHQTNGQDYVVNNGDTTFNLKKIGRFHYNKDYLWWVFFGTDARNSTSDGSTDTYKFIIPAQADTSAASSYEPSNFPASSWKNGLPGQTRFQALKVATLSAWFANQNKVWWGARFLDDNEAGKNTISADNGNASSVQVSRDINLFRPAANSSTANSSVTQFADLVPNTSTPLTYAFANSYAQLAYTSDSGSTFGTSSGGGQSGTEKPIPTCRKSFVVVFTDGIANDTYNTSGDAVGDWDPYNIDKNGAVTRTPGAGNAAVGDPAKGYGLSALAPSYASSHSGHSMFNIWTLAGVAAHYSNNAKTLASSNTTNYLVQDIMPFAITSRGASLTARRAIRTMTVGMSLAGSMSEVGSGKSDLYRAALYGNPDAQSWNPTTPPFDPNDSSSDPAVNPFFFDATDVTKLSQAMTAILSEVTAGSASIAAPSSPLVGLSLGNQVYLGLFQTAKNTRWPGDLLMAGLLVTSQGTFFVDRNNQVTSDLTSNNAIWSAADVIFQNKERTWATRNLYTNYDSSTNTTNTTKLVKFDTSTLPVSTNPAVVGAPDTATATSYIRFMRGAETAGETDPTDTTPRSDIMGDIISSSPVVLEYPSTTLSSNPSISPGLASFLAGKPTDGSAGPTHFRVIFVGDNQGFFHAFGEVSWTTTQTVTRTVVDNSTVPPTTTTTNYTANVPTASVDELWGFIPGEYLKYISQLRNKSNPHRYTMDGTPTVYFNDLNGNGLVDSGETVRVVVGQRKGGRSFYAFDFSDLGSVVANALPSGNSALAWKLVPDNITATDTQSKILARMGFSSSTAAIARVDTNAGTKDLVFIGGGLSTAALDTSLSGTYGSGTKFGRSLIAFDVVNGPSSSLYTWNFADSTFTSKFGSMGSIAAPVVPFDLVPGRERTWRVYFSDTPTDPNATLTSPRGGGVWALGQTDLFTTADGATVGNVTRKDSSNIDVWTGGTTVNTTQGIRHVFQAPTGYSVTTSPACFLIGNPSVYPVVRTVAPLVAPLTVALAFGTGDRNDPLDNDNINPVPVASAQNYLNLVFDRNDSSSLPPMSGVHSTNVDVDGILEGATTLTGDLKDLSSVSTTTDPLITPGTSTFYPSTNLGYKLDMGAPTAQSTAGMYYYPKVITAALVLNGVLYFSDFLPAQGNSGACTGSGITNTYRINNVLQPTFHNGTASDNPTSFNGADAQNSGIVLTYPNLPGELTALGTSGVIQSGQGATSSGSPGTIGTSGASLQSNQGNPSSRVFRPRTWRVIR